MSDFNETLLSAWVGKHSGWNILQTPPFVNNFVAGKQQQAAPLQPKIDDRPTFFIAHIIRHVSRWR